MIFNLLKKSSKSTSASGGDLASELSHVTQEMYKKNLELAEVNKMLSLLRKIDLIVLSSVTNIAQVAQELANTVVEDTSFIGVTIYVRETERLAPIAISQNSSNMAFYELLSNRFVPINPEDSPQNPLAQAVLAQQNQVSKQLIDIAKFQDLNEIAQIQNETKVHTILINPIIVRGQVIGVMCIFLGEDENMLSAFQRDLIDRIVRVAGIALDNALLFKSLNETTTKLQVANERLKELDKVKNEFVSLASHELRTPMTVIKSYLWMLDQGKIGPLNEKQKTYIDRAYSSTQRLINLVNDMLNVSRIESGRFTLDLKDTDINKLVDDVLTEMKPRAEELGIVLTAVFSSQNPHAIIDPDRIKQVLINLIGNAFKFTPQGGKITVSSDVAENRVVMQVADTGIGIEKQDLPKLFHKFGMVGNSYLTKMNTQGTGLGLYLSKSIIELHHGKILVVSKGRGKGTTFTFMLKSAQVPGKISASDEEMIHSEENMHQTKQSNHQAV